MWFGDYNERTTARFVNIISHSLFFFKPEWDGFQFPVLKQNKAGKRKNFSIF